MKKLFFPLWTFVLSTIVLADPGLIRLKNATINPETPVLQSEEKLLCSPTDFGKRNYIVQPKNNFSQSELEGLSKYDMEVIGHIPPNAYIIQADPAGLETFKSENGPLYVGEYKPAYKIDGELGKGPAQIASEEATVDLQIGLVSPEVFPQAKQKMEALGASTIVLRDKRLPFVFAKAQPGALWQIAALSEVISVEKRPELEIFNYYSHKPENLNSAALNASGYEGEGELVIVADSGLDGGDLSNLHPDLQEKTVYVSVGQDVRLYGGRSATDYQDYHGHGTHVAGTVLGRGTRDYKAPPDGYPTQTVKYPGVAPKASLYMICCGVPTSGSTGIYGPEWEDYEDGYGKGARLANNSWGGGTYGQYSSDSAYYDSITWCFQDFLQFFAAGNENTKIDVNNNCTISPQASAKNVVTVANAEGWNQYCHYAYGTSKEPYSGDNICWPCDNQHQGMCLSSSHGPCQDGRMKPDLAAPGVWITSLLGINQEPTPGTRSQYYQQMTGTSMATPNTCGCGAIVREYLRKNSLASNPSAALVKAVLINGCRSMGTGQYGNKTDPNTGNPYVEIPNTTPNCVSGYGHVNLVESLTPAAGDLTLLENSLANGDTASYKFSKDVAGPVKVTLCWSDYPGTPGAAQALVNDLDLEVSDGVTTYYAGGATSKSDSINNVEQYSCASFPAGENITVRVRGYNVMHGPQPFALAISGLAQVPEPAFLGLLGLLGGLLVLRNRETAK